MNNPEIKRLLWNRIHSIAVTIDPISLIGAEVVENENRPLSASERKNAENVYLKILKEINKKSKVVREGDISNLKKVFNDLQWESKCDGNVDLGGAYIIFEEKDWEFAKRKLSKMSEYTPNGTWNHVFFGVYNGVEKIVLHKIKDTI